MGAKENGGAKDQAKPGESPPAVKVLTAEDIEKADDRRIEPVDVPEWGGRVFVRSMYADERDRYESENADDEGKLNLLGFRARLAAATLCDESGKLLFRPDQVIVLGRKSAAALTRLVRAAQRLNGMGADALADAKKDSAETPSAGSPTASA